jgi:SAM-dependent methyltransferase
VPVASLDELEERRLRGAWFTPSALVRRLLDRCVPRHGNPTVLDPSCGDGAFLRALANHNPAASALGIDIDPVALRSARRVVPSARLWEVDALDREACASVGAPPPGSVDAIVGNPPYVRSRRLAPPVRERLRRDYGWARGQFDLTVPFIERSFEWLRPGGCLGLVLPNKVLVSGYGERLRAALRQQHRVVEVIDLAADETIFGDACAYPVLLIAHRGGASPTAPVTVATGAIRGGAVEIDASRTVDLADWQPGAPVILDEEAEAVWTRSELPRFGDVATAREAVHTGNLRSRLVVDRRVDERCQPLLRGRDVRRWKVRWAGLFLREDSSLVDRSAGEYASLPSPELFEGPKVLLREIALRPTAAYDPEGHRCLNKAYVLRTRPAEAAGPEGLLALCAVLNSTPFARLFRARFSAGHIRGGHLQFKPQWLNRVPMPPADRLQTAHLASLGAARILAGEGARADALDRRLDAAVSKLYCGSERALVDGPDLGATVVVA